MALINIAGKSYELVLENKAGFNLEAFRSRYSEVLERYDYIVGDWGYNQLRLKGFFKDGSSKATKDTTFAFATDYLNEYCNFGCAYFILEKKFDHNEHTEVEIDPLLADLEEDFDLPEVYKASPNKQQMKHDNDALEEDEKFDDIKPVKAASHNRIQPEKQNLQSKGQDKPSRRRPFKPRQNKNSEKASQQSQRAGSNGQQQGSTSTQTLVEGGKEHSPNPNKKNKRRSNKAFRHYDRKKNKEQAPVAQD